MSKAKANAEGLTLKHKIGYGLGDFGECMTFALMTGIFTRYTVNCLKIDTTVMAVLLFIWNVWDVINDPLLGTFLDMTYAKHRDPRGKFRPWLLRSAPMVCVTFIALWTVPTFFEGAAMLAALFICKIAYEAVYTMFNVPYSSLLAVMARDDGERAVLSSARGFGGMIGNMIPLIIFPILLSVFGDTSRGFGIGATVCAVIGMIGCLLHYGGPRSGFCPPRPKRRMAPGRSALRISLGCSGTTGPSSLCAFMGCASA